MSNLTHSETETNLLFDSEKWQDIPGYNGLYQISSLLRIRSVPKKNRRFRWHIKQLLLLKTGYPYISMTINGKHYNKMVHRLVAITFIPNPENKPEVNHINGVKTDYRIENLEWCTRKENVQHALRTGLSGVHKLPPSFGLNRMGGLNPYAKKVFQYTKQWELLRIWDSVADATRALGFKDGGISKSITSSRNSGTHRGYKWAYVLKS